MKKTAIIGIGIAIIVAGGLGIYAVSSTQEPTGAESTIGFGDEASVSVEGDIAEGEGEGVGFKEEAVASVEEPEEEPPERIEIIAEEKFGMGDKSP